MQYLKENWLRQWKEWEPEERNAAARRLAFAAILVVASVGGVFGFNALKPILIEMKMYAHLCDSGEKLPCDAQLQNINFLFQLAASFVNVAGLPIGFTVDYLGSKMTGMVGAVLWTACTIFLGFGVPYEGLYPFVFLVWAVSGGLFFFASLNLYGTFKAPLKQATSPILTVSYDFSAIMMVFASNLYYTVPTLGLGGVFLIWSVAGVCMFIFSVTVLRRCDENRGPVPQVNILEAIVSKTMLFGVIEAMACVLQQYFYISTVAEQALWVAHGDTGEQATLILAFNWILPALAPLGFVIATIIDGWAVGKRTPYRRFSLAAMNIVWTVFSLIPVPGLQYITYPFFVVWRIYSFICLYSTLKLWFSQRFFGRLAGLCVTMGGIACTTTPLLNNDMMVTHNGNPQLINGILGIVAVIAHLLAAYGYSGPVVAQIQPVIMPPESETIQTDGEDYHTSTTI